ncbi:MAG: single-stranded DNA-binding protein [Steroidobacteraceae bacterium]|jgi:single-stranded DNA-binding protein
MNSFTLTAVGNLARDPERADKGGLTYTRFCLIGNDYAGEDEGGAEREIATSIWFVAFGALGEAVARTARKGDQLIVEAQVRADNWVDQQGEHRYDYAHIVRGFRCGAPGKITRRRLEAAAQAREAAEAGAPADAPAGH